jgi:FkbM family methyltransferase
MLNSALGQERTINGRKYLETEIGRRGHAVYGPYEYRPAGSYKVFFEIAVLHAGTTKGDTPIVEVDVCSNEGRTIHTSIVFSRDEVICQPLSVSFVTKKKEKLEYRVYTHGNARLRLADRRPVTCSGDLLPGGAAALMFPDPEHFDTKSLFRAQIGYFGYLYDHGARLVADNSHVVITLNGVTIDATSWDDLRFISEILIDQEYNAVPFRDSIFVDIGMNVGLTSLFMASKPNIRAVYGYEPFKPTFERAVHNVALNKSIADKVRVFNYGIAARNEVLKVAINDDSGANNIFTAPANAEKTEAIEVRNAVDVLTPVFGEAVVRSLGVIMKVDCEGAEFEIFEALNQHGLFKYVDALMVEWHSVKSDLSQAELFEPLQQAGFIIFDLTNVRARKFFYAVRQSKT